MLFKESNYSFCLFNFFDINICGFLEKWLYKWSSLGYKGC